jgi:oligopeptidase B
MPATTYELNVKTGERRELKRQPVPGYDPSNYVTERLWATAGKGALLQYGYGSYGASMDPNFSVTTVSLLDRGMVYAIAHIRGGQEMGRAWYEDGKLLQQEEHLHRLHRRHRFPGEGRLCDPAGPRGRAGRQRRRPADGRGRQHGAGSVRGIVSQVPFVDVVTTMLDEAFR